MSDQSHRLDVARALLKCLLRGKEFVTHCEARLGEGGVPELADFRSREVAVMDRCGAFLEFLRGELEEIRADIDSRPAQPELPLGGDPAEKGVALREKLTGKRRAAE